jgi:hypothetical protein
MMKILDQLKTINLQFNAEQGLKWLREHTPHMSSTALQLLAVILLHATTLPSLISVMMAWTDRMPMLDMVVLVWAGLIAMFCQSLVVRNHLIAIVISVGFMLQSLFMAMIFFR